MCVCARGGEGLMNYLTGRSGIGVRVTPEKLKLEDCDGHEWWGGRWNDDARRSCYYSCAEGSENYFWGMGFSGFGVVVFNEKLYWNEYDSYACSW